MANIKYAPSPTIEAFVLDYLPGELFSTYILGPAGSAKTDDQADESHDYYYRLDRSARRSAASGGTVLAGIQQTRAAPVAPTSEVYLLQRLKGG